MELPSSKDETAFPHNTVQTTIENIEDIKYKHADISPARNNAGGECQEGWESVCNRNSVCQHFSENIDKKIDENLRPDRVRKVKKNVLINNINIENFQVDKGLGVLSIEVVTTSILRRPDRIVSIADTGPWVIARYELTIDRTGDILKIWSIPKYLWPLTER